MASVDDILYEIWCVMRKHGVTWGTPGEEIGLVADGGGYLADFVKLEPRGFAYRDEASGEWQHVLVDGIVMRHVSYDEWER